MTPHLQAGGDTGNSEGGGTLIFVSDASAEAERLTTTLRGRGYAVVDVPLGLLASRVSVQRPSLILCDADAAAALDTIRRVREVPGGNRIDVLFLGEPGRTVDDQAGALQQEASGVFVRPVDEHILLRKVEALIGAPSSRTEHGTRMPPANRAPVLVAATRRPYRYEAGKHESSGETPSSPGASAPSHELPSSPRAATDPGIVSAHILEHAPDSHPRSSAPSATANSLAPRAHELPQAKLSPALESLLATAERRVLSVRNSSVPPSDRLSPEAELEAILPADVLDALDEPLDFDDDDDDADSSSGTNNGSDADPGTRTGTKTTGAGSGSGAPVAAAAEAPASNARETVAPASDVPPSDEPESQSSRATEPPVTPPQPGARALQSETPERQGFDREPPPASRPMNTFGGATAHGPISDLPPSVRTPSEPGASISTTPPGARHAVEDPDSDSVAPAPRPEARRETPQLEIPTSLGTGDAVRAFARVVRARYTGALAFEDTSGIRRVLFRDGDFVTAASGADGESLVEFLTQRGDLPEDVAARIGRKLPQFGRHAGAALIAQGHLRQDDLWPVLRAHAEWLVARIVLLTRGAVSLESDAPARLQAEPAVFGGATGAEVLVEIVRRAVAPEEAVRRLGGASALLQKGTNQALLGECAIADAEADVVRSVGEEAISEVLRRVGHKDFAAVLYVLVELSVLALGSGERRSSRNASRAPAPKPDHLDHAALRARILSRKALSEEGDYFALLGVARSATSYDIRRAYTSLKAEFDPAHILTGETVDLREDVELILDVLAEAYEILEDDLRRDRYRRALDASP
ncbi:MAG TPA: DUF4388 domain-containing protein [Polyangiaceae bacterium]|nr:DUF4388 domain-containing protein [Polyangiaceae bacterium]